MEDDYENPDPTFQQRWENGKPHHPMSISLMKHMIEVDSSNGSPLDLKMGGDGDNGETIMYLMDSFWSTKPGDDCEESSSSSV